MSSYRWEKAKFGLKVAVTTLLGLWIIIFVAQNADESSKVSWVFRRVDTNVAIIILVSLIVGAVTGILLFALARRKRKE